MEKSIWHIAEGLREKGSVCLNWRLMTCGGRALVYAMLQEANWSRSSSWWAMSVQTAERYLGCKQRIRSAVNDRIGIEPNR